MPIRMRFEIECDLKEGALIEEVLAGTSAIIKSIGKVEAAEPASPPRGRRRGRSGTDVCKQVGTMKVEDAIVEVLKTQPQPIHVKLLEGLVSQKANAKYGKGTVPSAANRLARHEMIKRTGRAMFARLGA